MKTDFRYILLMQTDGCGTQLTRLRCLLSVARATDKQVLFDLSWYPTFRKHEQGTVPAELFDDIYSCDERLIVHPAEIAKVLSESNDDVLLIVAPFMIRNGIATEEAKRLGLEYTDSMTFLSHYSDIPAGSQTIDVFESLCFKAGLAKRYEELKRVVGKRVGVHARLGNGEVYRHSDKHQWRMAVSPELFFEKMDAIESDFFVCSDTPLFIDACKVRYQQRVFSCSDPTLQMGKSPSHLQPPAAKSDEGSAVSRFKNDLLEMRLLADCTELICNSSYFSNYAREVRKVPASVIESVDNPSLDTSSIQGNEAVVVNSNIQFQLLKALVRDEEAVILEIGAHRGGHSLRFINQFKDARIFCFEPDPRAREKLQAAVQKFENVTVMPAAVGARDGRQTFYQSGGWRNEQDKERFPAGWDCSGSLRSPKEHIAQHPWCTFESTIEVPVVTLNNFCRQHHLETIDFIWMDVQGAEVDVFEGASEVLKDVRFIYTEYASIELYEGQRGLRELLLMLPYFKVLLRYKNDVLLWNTRFHLPSSYELLYELNCVYLEKVKQGLI